MSTSPGCDNAPWPHAVTGCSLCQPYSFRGANIEHPVTRLSPDAWAALVAEARAYWDAWTPTSPPWTATRPTPTPSAPRASDE